MSFELCMKRISIRLENVGFYDGDFNSFYHFISDHICVILHRALACEPPLCYQDV